MEVTSDLQDGGVLGLVGPEELTLQALSLEQRDYRVFKDRLLWATLPVNRLV